MVKLVNRAKMGTTTSGTGPITLGAATSGYQSFAVAGVADGDVVGYVIEEGNNWEIGVGTYTASGTTLSRTPTESNIGGAAITLAGNAVVFVGVTASDLGPLPTLGTAGQVLTVNPEGTAAIWADGASGGGGTIASFLIKL
jgi:hypothetical protein